MTMTVRRKKTEPLRTGLSRNEIWEGPDQGLIMCWEIGRTRAETFPELAQKCLEGHLPVLGWKGGVPRTLKKRSKFGSLKYLAQWQGLRGEDLHIDPTQEITITCTATGMVVTFTPEQSKYLNQQTENDDEGEGTHGRSTSGVSEQLFLS